MKLTDQKLSDAQVIKALQDGTILETAVRYLYQSYFDKLTYFVRQNSGSEQDAEDYFHEALVVFIEMIRQGKFRGQSSIKTLLYSILRNLWCSELKRRSRAKQREKHYHEQSEPVTTDIQQLLTQHETNRQVLALIEQLEEKYRKILLLYYYEQMPMKQIFRVMGYQNEQVARNMKCKGMKKLSQLLNRHQGVKKACQELLNI